MEIYATMMQMQYNWLELRCSSGLEIHFFGGSKLLLLPGARPGSKTNFVVAKLYVHF